MYIALHTAPQKIVASSCILMTSACFMCFKIGETQKLMVPTEIGDWQVISTHLDHTHMCWPSFGKSPFCCSLYSPVFPFLQCQGQSSCKLLGPGVPCLLQETRSIVEILKQVYIPDINPMDIQMFLAISVNLEVLLHELCILLHSAS